MCNRALTIDSIQPFVSTFCDPDSIQPLSEVLNNYFCSTKMCFRNI